MTGLVIVIPAAGASSRMRGADKLLEKVDGVPLLARQAKMAAGTGYPVLVTVPPDRPERAEALAGLVGEPVSSQVVTDASEGISASIRAGAAWAAAQRADGLMILLADLPEIGRAEVAAMAEAFGRDRARVWRARDDSGLPGHPVIVPARLFAALGQARGDDGARAVLQAEDVGHVPLPGLCATTDLDTPEDWAAWRARVDPGAP